jgi:hypothetical protein
MNYLDYVPVIGTYRFVQRTQDKEVPFEERVQDAIMAGYVSTGYIFLAGQAGIHGHGMVRVAQATVAATPAALVATPVVLASVISAATYDRTVNESIRRTHGRTPYYGPFAGAFGTVV